MTELHVVSQANRHLYEDVLEDYFRLRHQIYVEERGWTELARPDGREIDQFDTPDTVYLMAMEGERVVGSHRLVPTTRPTLMSHVFPQLALRGLVHSPYVYELSRVFVVRDRRGDQAQPRVESVIMAGTMEFALLEGMTQFTIVMETWWVPRFQEIGWNPRPLGVPVDINGMNCVGVTINVTEEAWRETCRMRAVDRPVLAYRGLEQPALGLLEPALRRAG
ncbi:MAG TPA: acyl-homoserine-lactone synthase [Pseudolabrys sp.]|nr:acyl-homoserine-lactone synthase [Pseudolabrys sp.]